MYLRCSVGLSAVASSRQGASLSQTFGWITTHGLFLFLVRCIVVVIASVSLVVQHLTLAVGHVAQSGVLHGSGIGQGSAIKRRVSLQKTFHHCTKNNIFLFFKLSFF